MCQDPGPFFSRIVLGTREHAYILQTLMHVYSLCQLTADVVHVP